MNSWKIQTTGLFLVLSLGVNPIYSIPDKHDGGTTDSDKTGEKRDTIADIKLPENYQKFIYSLDKINVKADIKVVGVGAKVEDAKVFTLEKEKQLKALIEATKVVGKYRNKLKKCADQRDLAAGKIADVLDAYMNYLNDHMGEDVTKWKWMDEKIINTYTLQIQDFLINKVTKQSAKKADFILSDLELSKTLDQMAAILWGGNFRKAKFTKEEAKKDPVTQEIVKQMESATKSFDDKAKLDDATCKLDELTAPIEDTNKVGSDSKPNAGSTPAGTKPDSTVGQTDSTGPTPPVVDPGVGAATGATGAFGATGGFTPPPQNPGVAGAFGSLGIDPSLNGLQNNQIRDALDAIRRASDEQERNRQFQDQLLAQQLEQQRQDADANLRFAQGALQQATRPNNSRSAQRGDEVGPQISPQVDLSRPPQQPLPPPPPMQYPPNGGMPMGGMMIPPPQASPSLAGLGYQPSRFNDDAPRPRPLLPQQDPSTSALLETLKMQQQMWMGMMNGRFPWMTPGGSGPMGQFGQNGMMNGMYGGGQNVYGSVGNMLQNVGRVGVGRRSPMTGPRINTSRMNGSATSGSQGSLAINPGARVRPPSRLQ